MQAIIESLRRYQAAETQTWFHHCMMAIAMGTTKSELIEAELRADQERRDALVAAGKMDAYGNPFFEVGDLVTRDGTDIHRVVEHNGSPGHAPDGFTVVCVSPPADGWCEVGDEEFNTCRRYEWVTDPLAGNPANPKPGLPTVGTAMGIHERVLGAIVGSLRSALPGIPIYTQTPFRLTPPRAAVVIPAGAVPPLPLDRVERFLELSKCSPGLSRRARRRRRGERAAILKELSR